MIKMNIYSERVVNMKGIVTRTGEDTLPFANEHGMFVADGLGGAAGIRVVKFAPECFDPESLATLLCGQLNGNAADYEAYEAQYRQYLEANFASLACPEMQQLYQDPAANSVRLKKSGYFGSHAMGAGLAKLLITMPEQLKEKSWEEAVQEIPGKMMVEYNAILDRLGAECAKTSIGKISYFGTTVSAAFFREHEDHVEAYFLNCGDSRSYVWDAEGFRQAAEDQGRNGGMTNSVSQSDPENAVPSFEHRTYPKPCMLMCMTDGVYSLFGGNNGFHSTPMRMEGFFMNAMAKANSAEEFEAFLKTTFDRRGAIDDSNSMVVAAFGYEDYSAIKEAAAQRKDWLNKEYMLDAMPNDFLTEDYSKIAEELRRKAAGEIAPMLQTAYSLPSIQQHCKKKITEPELEGRYHREIRELSQQITDQSNLRKEQLQTLKRFAVNNYVDFADSGKYGHGCAVRKTAFGFGMSAAEKARNAGAAWKDKFHERNRLLDELLVQERKYAEQLQIFCDSMRFSTDDVWDHSQADKFKWQSTGMSQETKVLQISIQQKLNAIERCGSEMLKHQDNWIDYNRKAYDDACTAGVSAGFAELVERWCTPEGLALLEKQDMTISFTKKKILDGVRMCQECQNRMDELLEQKAGAAERAARKYWEDNGARDIEALLADPVVFAENPELMAQIQDKLNQDVELEKYRHLMNVQNDAFQRYLDIHLRDVSESKRQDVEKNGWL